MFPGTTLATATTEQNFVYQLITTILHDLFCLKLPWNSALNNGQPSPFMFLPYHFDRLRAAAAIHGWQDAVASISWDKFQLSCQHAIKAYDGPAKDGPLKLRVVLHRAGTITTTVQPVSPLIADPMLASQITPATDRLPQCLGDPIHLFLDKVATPSSTFTATKTTHRSHYAAARARYGLPDGGGPADVVLWNTKGMVTETSVRNLAFFRRGRWVTPHDSTGCLPGVTRRWLLEQGRVVIDDQGLLTRDNVKEGELVLIFNAIEGCRVAVVHLRKV